MFFGDGEREEGDVFERVIGVRRVGEGVSSVDADDVEVVLCGRGRNERC